MDPRSQDDAAVADLATMRVRYTAPGLREADLAATPLAQFASWLADAEQAGLTEPNAMVLATAAPEDGEIVPTARDVLLKQVDGRGFVFYTNLGSRKGQQLAANPGAGLVFPWFPMQRQVVVSGLAYPLDRQEVDSYFRRRPYDARIGAWASAQSTVVGSREELEERYEQLRARYPDTGRDDDVPLPPFWGGFLVRVRTIEFWAGRPSRLHDRLRYRTRSGSPEALDDAAAWLVERLSP